MHLTPEQQSIIESTGNIKINAVAGSGKTTTVIEYARTRSAGSRILYLAFNKTVKQEAARKLLEKGIGNVAVETAHSLAYRHIVSRSSYAVKANGYKTNEIAAILSLQAYNQKHGEYILANHINKFVAYFCNSNKPKVQELNYLDTISDAKTKAFIKPYYKYIEDGTRLLLAKMDKAEIEITHDFYLKKFQLSSPQLYYDYILFDEGQDASAAMLDVFLKQTATKVIVGDTHQQIYSWRYAINSLEKVDFPNFHLSASFRFAQPIANLANKVLELKKLIEKAPDITVYGKGSSATDKTKAVIARTNLGLLLKAIEIVTVENKLQHIYFEGNINSYTYADDGASLYDVLNLYNNRNHAIRDSLIKSMKSLAELEDYIEKTEDVQLSMMVEIVKEYGNEIPEIIKEIKSKHVENNDRQKAEMIFSTVHRCKGMEYDEIHLADDFITQEKIEKQLEKKDKNFAKINEEINLLYVAVTRTKNTIHIPEKLLPPDYIPSPQIVVVKAAEPEADIEMYSAYPTSYTSKRMEQKLLMPIQKNYFDTIRETKRDAYRPWTDELDIELTKLYCEGKNIGQLAEHFNRTKGAIKARIKKLELEDPYK
jgi:superfamily I DNA/RNA helicase